MREERDGAKKRGEASAWEGKWDEMGREGDDQVKRAANKQLRKRRGVPKEANGDEEGKGGEMKSKRRTNGEEQIIDLQLLVIISFCFGGFRWISFCFGGFRWISISISFDFHGFSGILLGGHLFIRRLAFIHSPLAIHSFANFILFLSLISFRGMS